MEVAACVFALETKYDVDGATPFLGAKMPSRSVANKNGIPDNTLYAGRRNIASEV